MPYILNSPQSPITTLNMFFVFARRRRCIVSLIIRTRLNPAVSTVSTRRPTDDDLANECTRPTRTDALKSRSASLTEGRKGLERIACAYTKSETD